MHVIRLLALTILACSLAGCVSLAGLAVETLDAKISAVRDEQCHLAHFVVGKSYCQSKRKAGEQAEVYCFQTLGGVDCYADRDPYAGGRSIRTSGASPLGQPTAPATAAPDATLPGVSTLERAEAGPATAPLASASRPEAAPDLRPTARSAANLQGN